MKAAFARIARRYRVQKWRWKKAFWQNIGPWAIALFLGTIIFAVAATAFPWNAFKSFGEFGDFVGGVANPLLALLGFLALLYTIRLQLNELSLSRDELRLTRSELKRSASALEMQNASLERQRLSQAFFDLFEMYKSVVSEIEHGSGETRRTGKSALARKANGYSPYAYMTDSPWSIDSILKTHENQNDDLGSYYRIIYRILSFLSETGAPADFFADMFRAQLTTAELHLLFFNCISDVGRPMQKFANQFEIFDNMPLPSGRGFKDVAKAVDRKSFGTNEALLSLLN